MEMKAKSSLIRKLRNDKHWSQEQLADACGLGLRTIQRVEARGSASLETIKSLASVLEVEAKSLYWPDGEFQTYKHRQWGWSLVVTIPILLAIVLVLYDLYGLPVVALGVISAVLTIVVLLLHSLTIEVNESEVHWYFGAGVFKKTIQLEEIAGVKQVKNPIWMGFGIHSFGTGWIYNISGLLGVEIELKSGAFIRLGSDEPAYLKQAIIDALDNAL